MKVTTDGCLFGAWVARELNVKAGMTALDIGTGTGLLSLMVAQQHNILVDAVELEPSAAHQARENINGSPWSSQVRVHASDIRDYVAQKPYDVIFSNPPFYEAELESENQARRMAHHSSGLLLDTLMQHVDRLLSAEGSVYLLLPFKRADFIRNLLGQYGFYLLKEVVVHPSEAHPPFRLLLHVSRKHADTVRETLYIRNRENIYTPEFVDLLHDYYLYL